MARTIRTETRKRGLFGWVFLTLFWAFNAIMAAALYFGIAGTAEQAATLTTEAQQAGAAAGAVIGAGILISIWASGTIILGILLWLTGGKKIITETVVE